MLGEVLAEAGLDAGYEVSWLPSYGPEMRSGTSNCHVRLSSAPIDSPLVSRPDVLLALNEPSLRKFLPNVVPGGTVLYNSEHLPEDCARPDVRMVAMRIIFFEIRLERVSLKRLIGAAVGSRAGDLRRLSDVAGAQPGGRPPFLQVCLLLWMTYVGLIVGAKKGDMLNLAALGGIFGGEKSSKKSFKILDTSVIIDGRIADIAETGFLDGVLVIPQFVLRELQLVADSADSMKRNRGRRGLDILQRVQKMAHLTCRSWKRISRTSAKWT
jgi:hypothetical protein